jgi:hypothetical protein
MKWNRRQFPSPQPWPTCDEQPHARPWTEYAPVVRSKTRGNAATWRALLAARLGRLVVALGRDLVLDSSSAHGVVHGVPVM